MSVEDVSVITLVIWNFQTSSTSSDWILKYWAFLIAVLIQKGNEVESSENDSIDSISLLKKKKKKRDKNMEWKWQERNDEYMKGRNEEENMKEKRDYKIFKTKW